MADLLPVEGGNATTSRFWLNLQAQYDLDVASDRLGARLDREVAAQAS